MRFAVPHPTPTPTHKKNCCLPLGKDGEDRVGDYVTNIFKIENILCLKFSVEYCYLVSYPW